ncbi:hypothetical protein BFP97_10100 [Roseivirga sp. 4D4]|nr:hypothetical protein BFP97_10100 [Roseivirga sp. 4D4]
MYFENSYDSFHAKSDRIYRLETDTYFRQEIIKTNAFTKYRSGKGIEARFPEVLETTRLVPFSENGTAFLFSKDEDALDRTTYLEKAYFSESTFFDIFTLEWIDKVQGLPLLKPNEVVVSEETALKLFPKKMSLGKSILGEEIRTRTTGQSKESWSIAGIFKAPPKNSHLVFGALFSLHDKDYLLNSESLPNTYTYLLVDDNYTYKMFQSSLVDMAKLSEFSHIEQDFLSLRALTDIHTATKVSNDPGQSANKTFILFLIVMGMIILILASTNYINGSIINSIERSKEIGVRKLVGIQPRQLVINVLTESTCINLIAGLIAFFLFIFGIRVVNVFTTIEYPNALDFLAILRSSLILLVLVVFAALVSGYYPASLLVNLKPIEALKGKTQVVSSKQSAKGSRVMRVLLIFQLTMSVIFISGLYIVQQQLAHVKEKDNKSFRMNLTAKFPGLTGANDMFAEQSEGYIRSLLNKGQVESAYISNLFNGQVKMKQKIKPLYQVGGDTTRLTDSFDLYVIDYHYFDGLDSKFLAGKNFSKRFGFDYNGVIVNEAALAAMRFNSPDSSINKKVRPYNGPLVVKGVIKNDSINDIPTVYVTGLRYPTYIDMTFITRGSSAEKLNEAVNLARQTWNQQFQGIYFLTRKYEEQNAMEKNLVRLFFFFTLLAVFIASLGIFGLSSFTAMKRTKEIGIRKILGANVSQILYVLIYDFLRLMFIGSAIAIPLVIYGAREWLDNYAFRINLHPGFALGPVIGMSLLAITIIVRRCWNTSIQSPIKALSTE